MEIMMILIIMLLSPGLVVLGQQLGVPAHLVLGLTQVQELHPGVHLHPQHQADLGKYLVKKENIYTA